MASESRRDDELDSLDLLLQDISAIKPITGRDEYLPLTRRIERGRLLLHLAENSFEITFRRIQTNLQRSLDKLNAECKLQGTPELVPAEFEKQVEEFLDNPRLLAPPALAYSLGQPTSAKGEDRQRFEKLGWYCFYLVALIPPDARASVLTARPTEAVLKHFRIVAYERKQARQRLIEGTLRYIVRIAASYIGRGLPYLDLVQEGYFGLERAADRYTEREGAHFQQYAAQWIHQRIMRAVADQSRLIRVPTHFQEKLAHLERFERECENDLVFDPHSHDQEIIKRLGLESGTNAEIRRHNGAKRLKRLREADAKHYPIDSMANLLVEPQSFEETVEMQLLSESINTWLLRLPERQREIISLRNGLEGGEARTLEEIGQMYGLTRERIRQIEAAAHKHLEHHRVKSTFRGSLPTTDHRISTAINDSQHALYDNLDALDMQRELIPDNTASERKRVEELIESRIMRGRKRMTGRRRGRGNRAGLLASVLAEHGQPLHYIDIYHRALKALTPGEHFTKEAAYATLFYNDRFRLIGGGVFALASWQSGVQETEAGRVFTHCPLPLLPSNARPRAFLESLVVALETVSKHQNLSVMEFYEEMLAWAGRDRLTQPQDAFDAWYAAGLFEYIHFNRQTRETIQLSIPADAELHEVRLHCLNHLCQRILKMSELLAALARLSQADIPMLQKLLFGSESAGYDVPIRLSLLASCEAVRADGSNWHITEIGRAMLQAHPPQELPDFSVIEGIELDDTAEGELDDELDIYAL